MKQTNVTITIQEAAHSQIKKLDMLLNGSPLFLTSDTALRQRVARSNSKGPLDLELKAFGCGEIHISLNYRQRKVLQKVLLFENGAAQFAIWGIPLLG